MPNEIPIPQPDSIFTLPKYRSLAEPLKYDYLLQLERDGFKELPVKAGDRLAVINVQKLLSGVESETQRQERSGNITNIYVGGDVGGHLAVGDDNTVISETK